MRNKDHKVALITLPVESKEQILRCFGKSILIFNNDFFLFYIDLHVFDVKIDDLHVLKPIVFEYFEVVDNFRAARHLSSVTKEDPKDMVMSSAKKDFRKSGVFKISYQILLQIFELATENSRRIPANQTVSQAVSQPANQQVSKQVTNQTSK